MNYLTILLLLEEILKYQYSKVSLFKFSFPSIYYYRVIYIPSGHCYILI